MKLTLRRIAPLQAGKLLGAFYGLFSLIFVPFFALAMVSARAAAKMDGAENAAPMPFIFGMGVGVMILMPVLYAAMGFLFGALSALIYNWLAGWLGGLGLEFEPEPSPPAPAVPPTLSP
jgi:hypothetical protein